MAVSIRLRREGTKNRPYYKVVVADSRSPRDGKFIEIIGTYDPKLQGENSTLKIDRAEHWIARGAQPSDTVRSLLKRNRAQSTAAPEEAATTPRSAAAEPEETATRSDEVPVESAPEPAVESAPETSPEAK